MTEQEAARPLSQEDDAEVIRHEEELAVGTRTTEAGSLHVRKQIETYPIEKRIERSSERVTGAEERVPTRDGDSGEVETLADGSISIPVFEEELVVTKRVVVRERVILRKSTVVDEHLIETELRKERVEIDADPGVVQTPLENESETQTDGQHSKGGER